jgi:uncharacterized protein (UPF0210 family)
MKPAIRTITGFISIKDFPQLDNLLRDILILKERCLNGNYEIQTIRITTDILEQNNLGLLAKSEAFLEKLEDNQDVYIYHLGSLEQSAILSEDIEEKLTAFFLGHKKAFLTINAGNSANAKTLCLSGARICKLIANKNPFDCRRFAIFAGVTESTPFYPVSKVFSNSLKFSIGVQGANLAVEEAKNSNGDRNAYEQKLQARMEQEFSVIDRLMPAELKSKFIGFDTSLAPFPQDEISIANAIEVILGKPFGSSGTLSVCRLLTKIMQENTIKKTGLCGLMLPVVEDNVLAKRGIEGRYTLNDLLLFSSVCATGLDTVPISGKTPTEDLADCYYDLVTLANKLQKPLSARFFIEPNKLPGETVKYDWKFASESPIFKI